ncbi:SDR family oxidoreductase [Cognatishimia sp. WU-CL00825]|uniref:SDR family NAD(P)-dependent oxidoreductase n=1 Tax=Cognatishimia sp. WU-CL00825 TaxID=3127658 RepID=UPI00310480E4
MVWPNKCFDGAHVLVTGATSGIGEGIALAFAEAGARVTVTGATPGEVQTAQSNHAAFDVQQLDVRDDTQVKALIGSFERLDHVVNCAGVIRRSEEHQPEVFADVVDINLTGTMRVCAAARGLLKTSKGTIVNMASMLSFFGGGSVPAYSASKGGISQLTKSLAIAYAPDGIRVNAIAPGWIATPLTSALQSDEVRSKAILDRTPLNRWGTPEDVAGGAVFLSSPMSQFVTGTVLPIDGGYLVT